MSDRLSVLAVSYPVSVIGIPSIG